MILVLESSGAHPLLVHDDKNDGVHLQESAKPVSFPSNIAVSLELTQGLGRKLHLL